MLCYYCCSTSFIYLFLRVSSLGLKLATILSQKIV